VRDRLILGSERVFVRKISLLPASVIQSSGARIVFYTTRDHTPSMALGNDRPVFRSNCQGIDAFATESVISVIFELVRVNLSFTSDLKTNRAGTTGDKNASRIRCRDYWNALATGDPWLETVRFVQFLTNPVCRLLNWQIDSGCGAHSSNAWFSADLQDFRRISILSFEPAIRSQIGSDRDFAGRIVSRQLIKYHFDAVLERQDQRLVWTKSSVLQISWSFPR
jgi:hypothetical protein